MIKKYLLKRWMLWCIVLMCHSCLAQDINQCWRLADSFAMHRNWNGALPLYYRIFYFGTDTMRHHATLGIIDASIQLRQYHDAEVVIEQYVEELQNPDWYREILVKKIVLLTLQRKFEQAAFILQQRQYAQLFDDTLSWFALQGLVYFLDDDIDNSILFCKKACFAYPDKLLQIDSLFLKYGKIKKHYSMRRAGTMSTAIAGFGQLYVGKPADAVKSFLLNYSLAALTVYVAWHYGVPNAMISFFPWNTRYYTGGIGKARQFAWERYNVEKEKIFKSLLAVLKNPAMGLH